MWKNFSIILLLIGTAILLYLLVTDSCGEKTQDVVKREVRQKDSDVFVTPSPVKVTEPTSQQTFNTIYEELNYDSLKKFIQSLSDSAKKVFEDELRIKICDSLNKIREHAFIKTDSIEGGGTITFNDSITTLGFLERYKRSYDLYIPPILTPKSKRYFSAGFIASTDTSLAPILMMTDKKKRTWIGGYDVLKKAVVVGAMMPLSRSK